MSNSNLLLKLTNAKHCLPYYRGPGFRISDYESNRIIGELQFRGAQTVMSGSLSAVSGAVRSVHVYVEM